MNPAKQPSVRTLIIRPYSKKELRLMYQVSEKTMTRWLRPHLEKIGPREGRYYNVRQVTVIFQVFGLPDSLYAAA